MFYRFFLRSSIALISCLALSNCVIGQELAVSVYFGEGSVWQRDQAISLRGSSKPNSRIEFSSNGLGESTVMSDALGQWQMRLPAHAAGGPFVYTLQSGKQSLEIQDVYIGDVYICAGQSNMEWPVDQTLNAASIVSLIDTKLRHLKIPKEASSKPLAEPDEAAFWQSAYPGRTEGFTAIGTYFAHAIRQKHPELPIGIINISWGGSRIEAWLPHASAPKSNSDQFENNRKTWAGLRQRYPLAFTPQGQNLGPHEPGGEPISVATHWENAGMPEVDGHIWFDRTVDLSDRQLGPDLVLALGAIDDSDSTFINGVLVGHTSEKYNQVRRYKIPNGVLKSGRNFISVNIEDSGGAGGFSSGKDSLYLQTKAGKLALGDGWLMRPEHIRYDSLGPPQLLPRLLYNGMLHTITGLHAAGFVWYQGEENASSTVDAEQYAGQIKSLLAEVRSITGQPALPFVAVELPEFMQATDEPYELYQYWPVLRESTRAIKDLAATATVVGLGYGDARDIHPRNKRPIGEMLADEIERIVYGKQDGPRFSSGIKLERAGQLLTVKFDQVGTGLKTTDGESIRGFAVQDTEGAWHHAQAEVTGTDRVRIIGPLGIKIEAVAYAWSNNPDEANLLNGFNRRVSSFRISMAE